jgi:DNA-binding LacI/PurR family transcriptional regulator
MTVSHVLNNRSEKVGAVTRERVMQVIDELHYSPSAIARGLSRRRLDSIGVVFYTQTPSRLVSASYHGDILGGILEAATSRGQSTTLFTEVGFTDNHTRVNVYCDGRCDGLIFVAPPAEPVLIRAMEHTQVPFVVIGEPLGESHWSYIGLDNIAAAKTAVEHLIAHGHQRIAFLGGNDKLSSSLLRGCGYREALSGAGMKIDPSLTLPGLYNAETGYQRAVTLMTRESNRPTAIFCCSDDIAFGALKALRDLNINVPDEVSVIGFDDRDGAATSIPPLTTMRQPVIQIGYQAVELLLEQVIEGVPAGRSEMWPAELVVRDSVATCAVDG